MCVISQIWFLLILIGCKFISYQTAIWQKHLSFPILGCIFSKGPRKVVPSLLQLVTSWDIGWSSPLGLQSYTLYQAAGFLQGFFSLGTCAEALAGLSRDCTVWLLSTRLANFNQCSIALWCTANDPHGPVVSWTFGVQSLEDQSSGSIYLAVGPASIEAGLALMLPTQRGCHTYALRLMPELRTTA